MIRPPPRGPPRPARRHRRRPAGRRGAQEQRGIADRARDPHRFVQVGTAAFVRPRRDQGLRPRDQPSASYFARCPRLCANASRPAGSPLPVAAGQRDLGPRLGETKLPQPAVPGAPLSPRRCRRRRPALRRARPRRAARSSAAGRCSRSPAAVGSSTSGQARTLPRPARRGRRSRTRPGGSRPTSPSRGRGTDRSRSRVRIGAPRRRRASPRRNGRSRPARARAPAGRRSWSRCRRPRARCAPPRARARSPRRSGPPSTAPSSTAAGRSAPARRRARRPGQRLPVLVDRRTNLAFGAGGPGEPEERIHGQVDAPDRSASSSASLAGAAGPGVQRPVARLRQVDQHFGAPLPPVRRQARQRGFQLVPRVRPQRDAGERPSARGAQVRDQVGPADALRDRDRLREQGRFLAVGRRAAARWAARVR